MIKTATKDIFVHDEALACVESEGKRLTVSKLSQDTSGPENVPKEVKASYDVSVRG
jgi:hypothetical protein